MEWAGLENLKDTPKKISIPGSNSSKKNREHFVNQCLSQFVEEYFLTEFDVEKEWRKNEEKRTTEKDQEESNDINVIEEEVVNNSESSSITDQATKDEIKPAINTIFISFNKYLYYTQCYIILCILLCFYTHGYDKIII